jgi:beta-glucosidase
MKRGEFLKLLTSAGLGSIAYPAFSEILRQQQSFKSGLFGPDFSWGVSTASYQIEGAWNEEGKGESIWDRFSHIHGKIKANATGDVACDFFHRYSDDLSLLRQLNFRNFRFSLSWPRILPNGTGTLNLKGIDFYNRVIDTSLNLGITPWITLYHWDLPQVLQDKGGWVNRDILQWFGEYCDQCTRIFGDRIKNWIVLNEPLAFTSLGYMTGLHAPGKKGLHNFLPALHHAALAQAEGGRIVRQNVRDSHVGTAISCSYIDPKKIVARHEHAAHKLDALFNRLFIEPTLGMGYPADSLAFLKRIEKYMLPNDLEKLKFDFDFIGLQNYFRIVGRHSLYPPLVWANQVSPGKLGHPLTEMGWEVYPEGIYMILKQFSKYPIRKIIVTENGAAFQDSMLNGAINDIQRIAFFKDYLSQVLKAKQEGVNIKGYFAWTFLDNFEWAEGYKPRFGLVYTDFNSLNRIPKASAYWFQEFLAS